MRTRQAGSRSFVSLHMLVPGAWTIQRGHEVAEQLEREMRAVLPHADLLTHIEPIEDPASFDDELLDRSVEAGLRESAEGEVPTKHTPSPLAPPEA